MTKYLREIKSNGGVSDWIDINPKGGDEYMVIDGVKYREVKRKAKVGEKIKILTKEWYENRYERGDVCDVTHSDICGVGFSTGRVFATAFHDTYVVLEPITEYPRVDIATSDSLAASDVDLIVLQRELNGLKRQQAEVTERFDELIALNSDLDVQIDGLTDAFAKLVAKTVVPQVKSEIPPQVLRDDIVEQAKLDVAELECTSRALCVPTLRGGKMSFYPRGNSNGNSPCDGVKYVVNRDKRTVVALIHWLDREETVWARGIAKCAPGDVFNSHIGRAIALRRALGLEVPTEYTNAPHPTEPRVGDIVRSTWYRSELTGPVVASEGDGLLYANEKAPRSDGNVWGLVKDLVIIDDSREESEVSA